MPASDLLNVHPLLADRVRLGIMAHLALATEPVDFNTLLLELGLTRGNLSTHLKKLEDAGLTEARKDFVDRKPRSTYTCTTEGQAAIRDYLRAVEGVLRQVG